ncbi:hypothetical protein FB466_0139 [Klugiella xanthotipulae]|uniref:Uncharacterized protein n=1 Tax=Klugiella xanthotipulae TaxID=244735 RepID=A0A543I417_9MICO|nr:hypothetical protein FB466_0139 [Klugiella xanthotipulae]
MILLPQCGGIMLGALTVGRYDRIIQAILTQRSVSAVIRETSTPIRPPTHSTDYTLVREEPTKPRPNQTVSDTILHQSLTVAKDVFEWSSQRTSESS